MSPELTPAEILARTREVYATCRTYRDRGVVVTRSVHSDPPRRSTDRKPFSTAFVRPDRFRFEWAEEDVGPEEEWDRMLILWNSEGVRSSSTTQPGIRVHGSIHDAIPCATGVSGGSAYTVPTLLLPGGKGRHPLPDPAEVTFRGRDRFAGHDCFVLEHALDLGGKQCLWIGCDDFLLQRIDLERLFDQGVLAELRKRMEEQFRSERSEEQRKIWAQAIEHFDAGMKPFRTEMTTTYEPDVDSSIEAACFEPPRSWSDPTHETTSGAREHSIAAVSPGELSAAELLARVRRTYGSCRSYQDTGVVTTVFIHDQPRPKRRTTKRPFSTAFVRPERFRFEYSMANVDPDEDLQRMLILWNGEGLRSWWTIQPGVRPHASFFDAVGQAAGVSGGSASFVPCLLVSCGGEHDPLPGDQSAVLLGTEELDGVDCFVLRGTVGGRVRDSVRTVWIGRADLLVHCAEETHVFDDEWYRLQRLRTLEDLERPMPEEARKGMQQWLARDSHEPFRTETIFTFEPRLDASVPDERFATPASWHGG